MSKKNEKYEIQYLSLYSGKWVAHRYANGLSYGTAVFNFCVEHLPGHCWRLRNTSKKTTELTHHE